MEIVHTIGLEPRVKKVRQSRIKGVQHYDSDNLYPQNIENIINQSVTTKSAVRLFKSFIKGNGFESQGDIKINETQTLNQLLTDVLRDYSQHYGFAIYFGFDLLGNLVNPVRVPFKYCRISDDDKKVVVYDNWDRRKGRIDKDKFKKYDFFDPLSTEESHKRGSRGQILYFSNDGFKTYPLSPIDACLEDSLSEYECKIFKLSNAKNSFMAKGVLEIGEISGDSDSIEDNNFHFKRELEKTKGVDGKQMLIASREASETPIKFHKFDIDNNDKVFSYTEESVSKSIIRAFSQPDLLHSLHTGGGIGTQNYIDAYNMYNNFTHDDRSNVNDIFNVFLPMIGLKTDTITPLEFKLFHDTKPRDTKEIQA